MHSPDTLLPDSGHCHPKPNLLLDLPATLKLQYKKYACGKGFIVDNASCIISMALECTDKKVSLSTICRVVNYKSGG